MTRSLAKPRLRCTCALLFTLVVSPLAYGQDWVANFKLGDSLYAAHQYDSAAVFWANQLQLVRANQEAPDTLEPYVIFKLANNHYSSARYDTALSLFATAIELGRSAWQPAGVTFANMYNSRGITLSRLGRYKKAEQSFLEALEIRRAVLGPEDPLIAGSLNNLAVAYRNMRRYTEAEAALLQSLAIRQAAFGPDDRRLASTYQNLGNVKAATGRYAEAEAMYRKALEIKETTRGAAHPSLSSSLNGLALAYTKQGRWADAEPLYNRSIKIVEDALGPEHPSITEPMANLAILYFNLSKFSEAEALDRRVLEIRQKRLGADHPEVAGIMSNLAHRLWVQGKTDEAAGLLRNALTLQHERYGKESAHTFNIHVLTGKFFAANHNYDSALTHFLAARSIVSDSTGLELAALAEVHEGIGRSLAQLGDLKLADTYYDSALTLMADLPGLVQARMSNVFESRSLLYRMMGEPEKAAKAALVALKFRQTSFSENALVLSERDALTFSQRVRWAAGYYFSAVLDAPEPSNETLIRAAESILSTKGEVSDQIFTRHHGFALESDSTVNALATQFRTVRFEVANRFVSGADGGQNAAAGSQLDSLLKVASDLEEQLARSSAAFRRSRAAAGAAGLISHDAVQRALPEQSVLVEFVAFDYHTPAGESVEPHYLALVMKATGQPVVVDLGPAAPIHALVETYREHFLGLAEHSGAAGADLERAYGQVSQGLYRALWTPLGEHIPVHANVYVSPDLALNLVSFAGLSDPSGRFLLEEHAIHYLSAGRDLVRSYGSTPGPTGWYALGDPDFDCTAELRLASVDMYPVSATDPIASSALRGATTDCDAFVSRSVHSLPGTRAELERVSSLWRESGSAPVMVRTGASASEELFKREAGSQRVVHLATHGYFIQSECAARQVHGSGTYLGENPLLLSGLYLAGANQRGEVGTSAEAEDGVLTAEEVAGMNFEDTRLVVLSACETGLGEVRQGEGVYGLRRAFQMSGVGTVVSALWRVPDQETAKFMTRLYTSQSGTYPGLMREASLAQLRELRQRGRSDHPFNWAGFVATGDWRVYR